MSKPSRRNRTARFRPIFHLVFVLSAGLLPGPRAHAAEEVGCWVSWGIGCNGWGCGSQLASLYAELSARRWPDAESALAEIGSAETRVFLGDTCVVQLSSDFALQKGTITQFVGGAPYVYAQSASGVPVTLYRQFQAFNAAGERCTVSPYEYVTDGNYFNHTQCRQRYQLRIENPGSASNTGSLADVEPGKTIALVARAYDQNNQLVPNVPVRLEAAVEAVSGGHEHDTGRHNNTVTDNRVGRLEPLPPSQGVVTQTGAVLTGNTGADGLVFNFVAPPIAGDHPILASCTDGKTCTQEGVKQLWVGVKGLEPIVSWSDPTTGPMYVLGGQNVYHPGNHYLKPAANSRLQWLAYSYRQLFPNDPPLYLNDASLERGGLFDIGPPNGPFWQTPHPTHRKGGEIDIRANPKVYPDSAIAEWNFVDFEDLVEQVRGTFCGAGGSNVAYLGQTKQHYHICLMGGNCCNGGN